MVVNQRRPATERIEAAGPPEATLVELLEAQALADALSGVALMRECGLHHSLWSRVRRGQDQFGPAACVKIVARYPSMRAAAARHLADRYGRPALTLLEEASRIARTRPACR